MATRVVDREFGRPPTLGALPDEGSVYILEAQNLGCRYFCMDFVSKVKHSWKQKKRLDMDIIVFPHASVPSIYFPRVYFLSTLAPNLTMGSHLPYFGMSTRCFGCRHASAWRCSER